MSIEKEPTPADILQNLDIIESTAPTKEELLYSLESLYKAYANLPPYSKAHPVTHSDLEVLVGVVLACFRAC